ncbi:MAG: InlB B-repeat-containing protein [Lachnospiraceae bacterium]
MKRRLPPILMTLVLVCALPIWAAFVTSGDVTNPLVCTAGATELTLQGMIDKANAGDTITLNSNTEIAATLQITKNLTLDLNGYVLKMGGTGRVIHITSSAEVEIKDGESNRAHTGEYAALPAGGVITGGKAESGGGILLDGGCTLKLTGGCITDCRATDTGGGGVDLRGSTAILYISGTARIENCTAGEMWGANAIFNSGTMYADGGTVDGTVNNQGTIKRSEGTADMDMTVFNKAVYNRAGKSIEAGIYKGTVENRGSITGGTFYGGVTDDGGTIRGGTFAVTFDRGDGTKTEPTLVEWNGKVSRPTSDPEKSGHTFVGWYLGDALYDFNTPVNAPLTLTARWEEVPSSGGNYYYHPTTDTKADDAKGSPKTADPGVALYAALSLLSLTGLTCTAKKR